MENIAPALTPELLKELRALSIKDAERCYLPFNALTIRLPWAPSVNNAYPSSKSGRRFPSKVLKTFKAGVWSAIYEQRIPRRRLAHPLTITITQHARTAAGDIDNGTKAVLDALVQCGVIADDCRSIVKRVTVEDGSRSKDPYVIVGVRVWEP